MLLLLLLLLMVTAWVAIVVKVVEVVEAFLPFRRRGSSSISCVETNITLQAAQPRRPRKARPSLQSEIQAEYPALSNTQMELSSVPPGTSPIIVTTPTGPTISVTPPSFHPSLEPDSNLNSVLASYDKIVTAAQHFSDSGFRNSIDNIQST
ncbi:hypothetical protein BKA70DRAFT_1467351 [Coprinopsis sp. MPI-PUGE-AT-0042]|nr:hypothetical protein BKA70DRAFT_1467351 [Coprinopsis sp. MPI-PUGE-AT-0042]